MLLMVYPWMQLNKAWTQQKQHPIKENVMNISEHPHSKTFMACSKSSKVTQKWVQEGYPHHMNGLSSPVYMAQSTTVTHIHGMNAEIPPDSCLSTSARKKNQL